MFDTFAALLDWFGITVFAISGALVASRKQMDLVGFVVLGTVTGIGGGSIRDVLLGGAPVFWISEPAYLVTCVAVSAATFLFAHIPQSRYMLLLWCDALGMALFAVTGAERALLAGASEIVAIAMGVITATFGGVLRDVLGREVPVILSREIYASAALAGAATFVALTAVGVSRDVGMSSGFGIGVVIRLAALRWNWSLPRYRARAGRSPYDVKP